MGFVRFSGIKPYSCTPIKDEPVVPCLIMYSMWRLMTQIDDLNHSSIVTCSSKSTKSTGDAHHAGNIKQKLSRSQTDEAVNSYLSLSKIDNAIHYTVRFSLVRGVCERPAAAAAVAAAGDCNEVALLQLQHD